MLFSFPIFGGFPGRGVLSRMKALLDRHSVVLDHVEGEDGITVRKNWKGGITIGGGGSASGLFAASICASLGGTQINCTGGHWTHRYDVVSVPDQVFWFGDPESIPDGAIALAEGVNFGFVEFDGGAGIVWGVQSTYPLNATTALRRCVFSVTISSGTASEFLPRNQGDVFS